MKKNKDKSSNEDSKGGLYSGLGGILGGLAGLVEKLGDLAEQGGKIERKGEFFDLGSSQEIKGVYGFSFKVGLGGEGPRFAPFGNIRQDRKTGQTVVEEIREPLVDLFDEEECVLVVAEMPGVGPGDLKVDLKDDILTLSASRQGVQFHKEVLLPQPFPQESMAVSCNNGIVEIKLSR